MAAYLTEECKITILATVSAGAAGTSTITSSSIDTSGWDGLCALVPLGPIVSGAVTSVKAQQSSDNGGSDDFSDIAGTSITIADTDDDKLKYIDIGRPDKRYVRFVVSRATQNATIGGIHALQYRGRVKPPTHGTGVAGEQWSSPSEGTA